MAGKGKRNKAAKIPPGAIPAQRPARHVKQIEESATPRADAAAQELQSLNEELRVVNSQPEKVEELEQANNDMANVRQTDEALRSSEERLRLALNAGKMGTWDWELATDAVVWDSRQFELYDIPREEFRRLGCSGAGQNSSGRPPAH